MQDRLDNEFDSLASELITLLRTVDSGNNTGGGHDHHVATGMNNESSSYKEDTKLQRLTLRLNYNQFFVGEEVRW